MKKTAAAGQHRRARALRITPTGASPEASTGSHPLLGERIRRLRHERHWSLRELEQRSTIATSTLSKVENGILSLPYDRLQSLASAFGLSLSEFFAAEPPSASVPAAVARISWARRGSGEIVDSGTYLSHFICTNLRAKRMVPILTQVKARNLAEFGRLLKHEGEEFVFAHQGRIEVHTEFYEPEILEQGEGVYIDSRMGHAYTNAGSGEAWIVSVNTNPILPEVTAKPRAVVPATRRPRS